MIESMIFNINLLHDRKTERQMKKGAEVTYYWIEFSSNISGISGVKTQVFSDELASSHMRMHGQQRYISYKGLAVVVKE